MGKIGRNFISSIMVLSILVGMFAMSVVYVSAEAAPVNILIHDCEKTDNITAFNGYGITLDTGDYTEGNSSVQFSASGTNTTFQIAISPNTAKDITGVKYILFDLYTEDPNMFTYSDRAIEFIDSSNVNSGRMGTSEALGNLTLSAGWNHIKIALGAFNEGFNASALSQISMFAVGQPNAATFKIDNVRLANDEGLADIDYLYQDFSAINTGYNCFAIQDIDNTEAREGNSCLFVKTFTGYNNLEVIMQNTNSYNFSGLTYLVFDLKTDDVNLFKNADDCAVSFFNGDAFSGRAVTGAALKSINLVQGWNHIVVPFSYTELQNNFDASSISKISLYCYYIAGYPDGQIYKFDNFRICNYEGLEKQEAAYNVVDKISAIGDVTIGSKAAIAEARTAYDSLTVLQKDVVYNYATLKSAESAYAALNPVNILFNDCEKTDSIAAFNGYNVTLDTTDHTEGNSSVQLSTSGTNTTFQIAITPNTAKNITGAKYILFDLYTEDPNMFTYSDRAIEFIDSSNVNSGRMGTSEALGNLTLKAGWNHIKIELGAFNEGFNAAALSQISMFAVGQPNAATFKIDNVRLANDEGLDEIDYLYQDFSAINTGYNCFAIQDIDNTEAREGNSCLFTETYTGYNNFEVILHNAGLYDFSGITYLVFDFKTDNVNFFKNADDCAVSFFNDDAFSGRAVTGAALKSISLVQGWNHIVVPFSYTELQSNFDVTSINKIVLYSYYIAGYPDGQIYKFDNFRICNYEGFEKQEAAYGIVDKISAIGEVTAESNSAITEARTAYDSLTTSQKDVVYNYATLTSAETAYLGILDNQKASTVIDYIDAIGTVTKDSGTVIETARTAYDALTVDQQALVTNYSILTDAEAAYKALIAGPVNILFNDCEKTDNIAAFNGYNVTLDTTDHTEGNSSVQLSTSNQNTTFQIAITPNTAKNITGAKYILFDLYTEDPNMFTYSDHAIEFIDSSNVNSGRMGTSEALGNLTLKAGWNHIKIELGAFNEGFNATALSQISMFAVGQPNAATFKIDNVRLANDEGLAEKDYLYQDFSALNTGYNCFAIQDIDNTEARQGNTCLFTQTFKDYRNLEVIMQNTNSYNFSGITYLVFDLKTDDVNLFKNADDCAVSFFNGDAFSGRAVTSAALKSINLVQGWNHIVVPFSYTELQNNFDDSSISKISLYCYYIAGYTEGQIYKFDNFRVCNYEGLVKQEAAYNIVDKIAAIGEVTTESNTAITEARTAYEALNASQKDVVYNYVTLTDAEASYVQVLNAQAAVPVIGYINAIGTVTKDSGTAIDTARNAYNALTGEQQEAVSNYETLTAAETAYAKITDDNAKADAVIKLITDIGTVTIESEAKITAARTAYSALTADQKSLVNNYNDLTAAETVLAKLKDDTAKADEAEALITDIGTVTAESGVKITAARTAYDALTADQKLLVNNYDVLTAAEAAYDALVVYGDINGDGKITAADALLALQYSVQKITLTEQQIKAADIDNKAGVTAADALLILQYSVDKIDSFPIQNAK